MDSTSTTKNVIRMDSEELFNELTLMVARVQMHCARRRSNGNPMRYGVIVQSEPLREFERCGGYTVAKHEDSVGITRIEWVTPVGSMRAFHDPEDDVYGVQWRSGSGPLTIVDRSAIWEAVVSDYHRLVGASAKEHMESGKNG